MHAISGTNQMKLVAGICVLILSCALGGNVEDLTADLSRQAHQFGCNGDAPVTLARLQLSQEASCLSNEEKQKLIGSAADLLTLSASDIRLIHSTEPDVQVLISGKAPNVEGKATGCTLQWLVGCGDVRPHHVTVLEQIEQDCAEGKLNDQLKADVTGWQVGTVRLRRDASNQMLNHRKRHGTKVRRYRSLTPMATPTAHPSPTATPLSHPVTESVVPDHIVTTPRYDSTSTKSTKAAVTRRRKPKPKKKKTKRPNRRRTTIAKTVPIKSTALPTVLTTNATSIESFETMMNPFISTAHTTSMSTSTMFTSTSLSSTTARTSSTTMMTSSTSSLTTSSTTSGTTSTTVSSTTSSTTSSTSSSTTSSTTSFTTSSTFSSTTSTTSSSTTSSEVPTTTSTTDASAAHSHGSGMRKHDISLSSGDVHYLELPEMFKKIRSIEVIDESDKELRHNHWFFSTDKRRRWIMNPLPENSGVFRFMMRNKRRHSSHVKYTVHVVKPSVANHVYTMVLNLNFTALQKRSSNRLSLLEGVSSIFGDENAEAMRVVEFSNGSAILSWTNVTLTSEKQRKYTKRSIEAHKDHGCPTLKIRSLTQSLVDSSGEVTAEAQHKLDVRVRHLKLDDGPIIQKVTVEGHAECHGVVLGPEPQERPVKPLDEENTLLTIVIPSVIIGLMILIAVIIACCLCRRQRIKAYEANSLTRQKSAAPMIFMNELADSKNTYQPLLVSDGSTRASSVAPTQVEDDDSEIFSSRSQSLLRHPPPPYSPASTLRRM